LGHGISPEDGLLDAIVVRANGLWDTMRAVWHVLRDLPADQGDGTFIGYARGKRIHIETDTIQPAELDGEAGGTTPFTVEAIPAAISVAVPKT
jgi:diacylglycerol kinase family enzyme